MNTVYVVFEGDSHLSSSSLQLRGVFSAMSGAISHIVAHTDWEQAAKELKVWDNYTTVKSRYFYTKVSLENMLFQYQQTQGLSTNYLIQQVEVGVWQ